MKVSLVEVGNTDLVIEKKFMDTIFVPRLHSAGPSATIDKVFFFFFLRNKHTQEKGKEVLMQRNTTNSTQKLW